MLRRLRFRYEQMLSQSLQGAVQIELGLVSRSSAVQQSASLSLRLPDQPDQPLPPHTSIVEAYELAKQELLILGEPGAGKSTLLLELAHHLVEQAENGEDAPLPLLIPLSSWADKHLPLQDWLIEQMASLYDVSRKLSRQWVQAQQILPLLDGLDEMSEAARPDCIEAINTYHREYLGPLVVCSRTNEYERAAKRERLALHTAVIVQPLSYAEVNTHLVTLGKPLSGLRAALKKNTLLQNVATTPLMLQVLMLTYHGTSVRELSHKEASLQEQIWTDYTQQMITRKGNIRRSPPDLTVSRLRWLASQMRSRNQTIFLLEHLQPDWLSRKGRILYRSGITLLYGLLVGLLFGLIAGLIAGLTAGLLAGLLAGLTAGLLAGLLVGLPVGLRFGLSSKKINPAEALTWSKEGIQLGLIAGLLFGLLFGLFTGLLTGLLTGLIAGLLAGLIAGLTVGLSRGQLAERFMLSPNEGIRRSRANGLLAGLLVGLLVGLPTGLLFWLLIGPYTGLLVGLLTGPRTGLSAGLDAVLEHYTLRISLACFSPFPLKAIPFLEDATACILLRRVGGGYSFTHRLLLDHFADMDAPGDSSPRSQ
jgi:hypothetical protein